MMDKTAFGFPQGYLPNILRQLARESDRGRLLLAGICIEELLTAKFLNEGLQRMTLAEMLKRSRKAGWIDEDVFHDAEIIRALRNRCAHEGGPIEIDAEDIRTSLERFRVPHRRYYDWGKIGIATTPNGFVMYNGSRPAHAIEDSYLPGLMTFNIAISVILLVLAANLEIPFATDKPGTVVIFELPEFMRSGI
jgi:hypothetical protein